MKKLITIIGILGIILIISICLINKKQNTKNPVLPKAQPIYTDNGISNIAKQDSAVLEILPTMNSVSIAKNQVWAGVFQLVWDDLANEINKGPILFEGSQPEMANLLNKNSFSVKDLSADSYYKKWGLVSPQLKQEIEEAIWTKFQEKSNILDSFNWSSAPEKYILYTMLKKDLEYVEEFKTLQQDLFKGSSSYVNYFGVITSGSSKLKESVNVLFYKDYDNFAVTLKSKQGDLIHLYRTDDNKTLAEFYSEMKQKSNTEKDYLHEEDKFKAPALDFNIQHEFDELNNKKIMPSGFIIEKAIEAIKFKGNKLGEPIAREAKTSSTWGNHPHIQPKFIRNFYFTGPYAIFMEEPGKQPYFAAYITDPAPLQK